MKSLNLLHELAIGNVFGIGRPLQVGEASHFPQQIIYFLILGAQRPRPASPACAVAASPCNGPANVEARSRRRNAWSFSDVGSSKT